MQSPAFLSALRTATHELCATVRTRFAPLDLAVLNQQPSAQGWSILQCLEHLNRYSRYYNPALQRALANSLPAAAHEVNYSWLGRKSVALMHPSNAKAQTTIRRMNPSGSSLTRNVLDEFEAHQTELLRLFDQAATADLNRKAVPVEFFKLLRLQLGEALEFVVVHQQRHVAQAGRVKDGLGS